MKDTEGKRRKGGNQNPQAQYCNIAQYKRDGTRPSYNMRIFWEGESF